MNTTFIYTLLDPRTHAVRYVGKSDRPHKRWISHCNGYYELKSMKNSWIQSLATQGLRPELVVIEETTVDQWEDRERYWIAYYRQAGCDLTNGTEGGIGAYKLHPDARRRISDSNRGKKRSPEAITKTANAHRGRKRTPETIAKMRAAMLGKKLSPFQVERIRASHIGHGPSPQARARLIELIKGKPVTPETLAKKRATMAERKAQGLYNKPHKPIPPEAIARRNQTNRERNQQRRLARAYPYHETELAHTVYVAYLNMGSSRSIAKLASIRKCAGCASACTVSVLKDFSSRYHWRERVAQDDALRSANYAQAHLFSGAVGAG